MPNIRVLARNLVDEATSIIATAAAASGYPVTNLQRDTERGRTFRSGGLSSQDIALAFPSDVKANMAGFTRHNWSTASTFRQQLYAAGSPTAASYDGTPLTGFSTSGLDTDLDVYTERDFAHLRNSVQYFTERTDVREARSTVADAANADGYIEMTRMWFGKYFEFTYNAEHGDFQMTQDDASVAGRADDGSHIVDKRWKARKLSLNIRLVPDTDLPTVLAIARRIGRDKECFVSVYPGAGGAKELYNQGAFRLVQSPTFDPHTYGYHKFMMSFEET